jgi:hypothetical protein
MSYSYRAPEEPVNNSSTGSSQFITPPNTFHDAPTQEGASSITFVEQNRGFSSFENGKALPTVNTSSGQFPDDSSSVPFPYANNNYSTQQSAQTFAPLTPAASPSPSVRMPEPFNGDRDSLRGFLAQVHLVFLMNPRAYPTDSMKVGFVALLFTGRALQWITPFLSQRTRFEYLLSDYNLFIETLTEAFGDPDRTHIAASRMTQLNQGTDTVTRYVTNFRMIAADLDWPDAPLMHFFEAGLSQNIREMLLHHDKPATLNEMIRLAHTIDARILEHRANIRGDSRFLNTKLLANKTPFVPPPRPIVSPRPSARPIDANPFPPMARIPQDDPMDVGQSRGISRRVSFLDSKEKKRRKELGLCAYCGDAKHSVEFCSVKPKRVTDGQFSQTDTLIDDQGKEEGQ